MLTRQQEAALHRKLEAIEAIEAVMVVNRFSPGVEEAWLFVVLRGAQLEAQLSANISGVVADVLGVTCPTCHVCQLSSLPVTRRGRPIKRELERFVNDQVLPARSRMQNPEILLEVVKLIGATTTRALFDEQVDVVEPGT